jgi:hypothetical protein
MAAAAQAADAIKESTVADFPTIDALRQCGRCTALSGRCIRARHALNCELPCCFVLHLCLRLCFGRSHLISSIRQNATGMDRASVSGIVTAFDHKLFNDDTRIARIGHPLTPLCAPCARAWRARAQRRAVSAALRSQRCPQPMACRTIWDSRMGK